MSSDISFMELVRKEEFSRLQRRLSRLPVELKVPAFADWAEENRYLPEGVSVYPGRLSFDIAPHMREPLDMLHPDNPVHQVSMLKSVQSTATTNLAENAIGAYIRHKLGSILYLTSSKGVAKIRSSSAIDVLIDHSDLAALVRPMSDRSKRKSADTSYYKEFSGGIKLLMSSYNSIGDLKSNTFHFIIKDEWDEAPMELKDQGDVEGIIHGRTMGVRNYKILDISTPSRLETSRIYKSFLQGDQRYFYVPCPLCGEFQTLELKGGDKDHGLTFSREKDPKTGHKILIPETVRYICAHCRGEFQESKKADMLRAGEWRPTSQPSDPAHVSYHVSGLYSPEMMLSWRRIVQQFIDTDFGQDLPRFKDFTINYLGRPWAHAQKHTEWTELRARAEDYAYGSRELPGRLLTNPETYSGPLILTAGVDVQKDRIELQVVGWGIGLESWSIDYRIFYGNPGNIDDPSWIGLDEYIYTKTFLIGNVETYVSMCAVDCGYDPRAEVRVKDWTGKTSVVYEFVSQRPDRFIAVMGVDDQKVLTPIKEARVDGHLLKKRYNLATGLFKEMLYSALDIHSGPGAIHFPRYAVNDSGQQRELPDDHWRQFMSERYQEIRPGQFGWKKIYRRNEVLDTYVYARAAAEFHGLNGWTADRWLAYYWEVAS